MSSVFWNVLARLVSIQLMMSFGARLEGSFRPSAAFARDARHERSTWSIALSVFVVAPDMAATTKRNFIRFA